jgi:hypothetical protein
MKKPRHPITDHAVVRYLELVQGWDIDMVRAHIAELACPAIEVGASAKIIDGFKYKFTNGRVVTVVPVGETKASVKE